MRSPPFSQAAAMGGWRLALCILAWVICAVGRPVPAKANNEMFPPAPAARESIDFDGRGFSVNGQRTWIASGGIDYAKVPRGLWRDRLLRLKRAGFNCVETDVFWNYHETQEGKFDFSGEKDFGAFLDLAKEVGLYAMVCVGPYSGCTGSSGAGWEGGGLPLWLRFQPGIRIREDEPGFRAAADRWFEHLLPLVAARQIHKGGAVIMVQLESGHPRASGTETPNPYFIHLLEKARSLGVEVPMFFSGLHPGPDPAPRMPEGVGSRGTPWFTSGFCLEAQEASEDRGNQETPARQALRIERGLWRILANGGNGYNLRMFHDGTFFDHWADGDSNSDAGEDGGAPVGQAGELRPLYYRLKRAALFARSFEAILEGSDNATGEFQDAVADGALSARAAEAGTLLFLDNPKDAAAMAHLPDGSELRLDAGETVALVRDFALNPSFQIAASAARILGIAHQGATTTLVLYGPPGQTGGIRFKVTGKAVPDNPEGWSGDPADPNLVTLKVAFPQAAPEEHLLSSGTEKLRVLAMSTAMADHTWFVESQGRQYVLCGPEYVGDFSAPAGRVEVTFEDAFSRNGPYTALVYGAEGPPLRIAADGAQSPGPPPAPKLQDWQMLRADAEARPGSGPGPGLDDSRWLASEQPLPMGVDGDPGVYAWYRTAFRVEEAGRQFLQIPFVGDQALVFLNGKRIPAPATSGVLLLPVDLQAGENTVALLASHNGRTNYFETLGLIDKMDPKGIAGPVTLSAAPRPLIALELWRVKNVGNDPGDQPASLLVDSNGRDWADFKVEAGASHRSFRDSKPGYTWYRIKLPQIPGPRRKVQIGFVRDGAVVYLNGQKLGVAPGSGVPFEFGLDTGWRASGNALSVRVENNSGDGGILGQPLLTSQQPDLVIKGWKMRGGLPNPFDGKAKWQTQAAAASTEVPTFYRAQFRKTETPGAEAALRFSTENLSRGMVWLNGHNLGRYPGNSLYLPAPWLKPGENTLVVLDEGGVRPASAALTVEPAASRRISRAAQ